MTRVPLRPTPAQRSLEESMSAFFREVLWIRLKRNRMAMAGALIVLVMFCLALLAPVAGRDPGAIDIVHRLQPPSLFHI